MPPEKFLSNKSMQEWLNKKYKNKKILEELQKQFHSNSPFPHLVLPDFLNTEKLTKILPALTKEEFIEKEGDLFKFMQTHDFATSSLPELQDIRTFLSSDAFLSYIETLTKTKLKKNSIDISASLYQNTDYLLPHDDQLENRKVAFHLYLSDLEDHDGGKLILYKTKGTIPREEEKAIIPKAGTFIIFTVSQKSFHEVEELITNKQRITIGGWFHGINHTPTLPQQREY